MRNRNSSTIIYIAIAAVLALPVCQAIKCYRCNVKPPSRVSNETNRPCVTFTPSREYEVDCPHSTLCMKHTYRLPLQNGSVESTLRDCAPQRYHYREYENEKWERKMRVDEEAYEEGCLVSNAGQELKPTSAEYCYCSRHLCNSGKSAHDTTSAAHTDAMAVIFVFNAMKYIRSLR